MIFDTLDIEKQQQIQSYLTLVIEKNKELNLTRIDTEEKGMLLHIEDSLSCLDEFSRQEGDFLDIGTGGGFPGIPLAILFPETKFHLVDSIGKKVRVATEVANAIGLKNVTFRHARAEEEKQLFDFVVSRAVMPLADLIKIIKKNISPKQQNAMPNGLICLKGGELEHETMPFKHKTVIHSLSENFEEEFFETKKVVYSQI